MQLNSDTKVASLSRYPMNLINVTALSSTKTTIILSYSLSCACLKGFLLAELNNFLRVTSPLLSWFSSLCCLSSPPFRNDFLSHSIILNGFFWKVLALSNWSSHQCRALPGSSKPLITAASAPSQTSCICWQYHTIKPPLCFFLFFPVQGNKENCIGAEDEEGEVIWNRSLSLPKWLYNLRYFYIHVFWGWIIHLHFCLTAKVSGVGSETQWEAVF